MVYWYGKAAELGDEDAQQWMDRYNRAQQYDPVADMLEKAEGYDKGINGYSVDKKLALQWYEKAAEEGDTDAIHEAGFRYYNGVGCSKNPEKALYGIEKLAETGNAAAMVTVAAMYRGNEGFPANKEKEFYWMKKAAENGEGVAMNDLAVMYMFGQGTKINLDQAKYWFKKASDSSDPKVSAKAKETLKTFDILFKDK